MSTENTEEFGIVVYTIHFGIERERGGGKEGETARRGEKSGNSNRH